jgi:hypothetical protein
MVTNQETKLKEIESKVTALKNKLQRELTLTTVVGALLLAAFCGYFWYGYNEIDDLLQPQMLVDMAGTMTEDKLPELRVQLENEVEKNAPVWAEELSRQAIASVPAVREQLENHIIARADLIASETISVTRPEIEKFLKDNKTEISTAISELKKDNVLSDESIAAIEKALNETFQVDMKAQAAEAVKTLEEITAKGTFLRDGQNLPDIDQKLRDIVMILRRFHLREKGNG